MYFFVIIYRLAEKRIYKNATLRRGGRYGRRDQI